MVLICLLWGCVWWDICDIWRHWIQLCSKMGNALQKVERILKKMLKAPFNVGSYQHFIYAPWFGRVPAKTLPMLNCLLSKLLQFNLPHYIHTHHFESYTFEAYTQLQGNAIPPLLWLCHEKNRLTQWYRKPTYIGTNTSQHTIKHSQTHWHKM